MTAQLPEPLQYQGETLAMCTNPLDDYFALKGSRPIFAFTCTALWRGYVGQWEIVDDLLYLVGLSGELMDGGEVTLATIFPDYPDRVFAHWYCGTLRIPQGKQLEYVHMGYGSRYEQDLLIDVDRGVVTNTRVRHNGKAGSDEASQEAPEGYAVGGLTLFPRPRPGDEEAK